MILLQYTSEIYKQYVPLKILRVRILYYLPCDSATKRQTRSSTHSAAILSVYRQGCLASIKRRNFIRPLHRNETQSVLKTGYRGQISISMGQMR